MEELARPHPGARPGEIGIDLPSGVRLSVDSYLRTLLIHSARAVVGTTFWKDVAPRPCPT
ncbi:MULTISPECIES: hypothetical protein [Sphingobium]|uniref:hypothetical protein n=1 Tax=Sphingobium TaxID=165695 RepID=UPI002101B693|nr:hypothetical protein [Sphingobium sp. 15-1]